MISSAKEITVFWQELMDFWRDMLIFRSAKSPEKYLDLTTEEENSLRELSAAFNGATLLRHCTLLEEAYNSMLRQGASKRLIAEMTFLKMCDGKLDTAPAGLIARISALEERLAGITSGSIQASTPEKTVSNAPVAPKNLASSDTVMYKKTVTELAQKQSETLLKSTNPPTRQGLKAVTWWAEATKKISESSPWISPFMRLSRAYENDGRLLVRVDGSIARDMLDTPDMRATLSSLSASFSQTPFTPDAIDFMDTGNKGDEKLPIDDLSED
jgi:DNA polymerase III gamma/tau subunit